MNKEPHIVTPKVSDWTTKLLRWIDDEDFAERLATKLSESDLKKLMKEFDGAVRGYLRRWSQAVLENKLQRDRIARLEEMSKEPTE